MSGWRKRNIVEMAREAGWTSYDSQDERFEAFAKLVRADEREVLCKLMEDQNTWDLYDPNVTAIEIIRARGNT
jgi:hypothetical protein